MSAKPKTWGVKLYPQEHEQINSLISDEKLISGEGQTKREAFLKLLSRLDSKAPEVYEPLSDVDLSGLCELDFLKRIIGDKDGFLKWFCLRTSRPDRGGKPILMGDGRDPDTIRALCQACKDGWMWSQQQKLSDDQIEAIKRFGKEEIEAHLFICNHPESSHVQLSPNPRKDFLCRLTGNRQMIEKKCLRDPCPSLVHHTLKVVVKDTPQFNELQKQLEEKTKK
jgi:hypothetical protein